ncbi:sensor histidine kinase [Palleronia rufa]|uniref:sensor histidine kinase n=1 Tax=Palleronia rufa TaxID=1530186 RepID=UPI0005630265|nr:sensor histidine kinase [Palleronia rufa]
MAERMAAHTMSLTARMVIGLTALLLVGGAALSVAALIYGRTAARDAFDRLLVGAAASIAASVSVEDGTPVVDLPVSAFELLALAPDDRVAYRVTGPGGGLLTGYADLPAGPAPERAGTVFYDAPFGTEPARYVRTSRLFAERSFSGRVEITVGQTRRARTELAWDITRRALIVLGILGGAVLIMAVVVIRTALSPLDQLARTLSARDPQDLDRLDTRVPREVAAMVEAMNGFMARLDRQLASMRTLISDSAHQLRTPVAALRAQADLAAGATDDRQRAQLVGRIHARTIGLGRLLDQMLARARVAHRADAVRRARIDLRDIALDVVESGDHTLVAPGAELRLEIGEDPVAVRGDALSLREAVSNLVANALIHGVPPVRIGTDLAKGARIWVEDQGPGIPPALRDRLGDRFLGATGSRGASSGLGLAIASEMARSFGGRLWVEDRPDAFRIGLAFPQDPA